MSQRRCSLQNGELIAVVTGASSGIGRRIALGLAERGATLGIAGRNAGALTEVALRAEERGGSARQYLADFAQDHEVERLAERLRQDFESIDMLIHSAGTFGMGEIGSAPVGAFDRQYRVNVRAPYLLTQALLPQLGRRKGQVVFINSSAGLTAKAQVGQYSATKHALKALADSLREEVNGQGIRVLSIYPGRTATPMQARVHELEQRTYLPDRFLQPEDVAAVVLQTLLLSRSAEVTDLQIRPSKKWDTQHA